MTIAVAVGIVVALAPSAPRAGDVERVQRACEAIRHQYSAGDNNWKMNRQMFGGRVRAMQDSPITVTSHGTTKWQLTLPDVDFRLYTLFCE